MKKRILSMLLAIVMVVGLVPGFAVTASAATEVYASGNLGQGNKTAWTIYDNGLLVIDGKGNSISTKWDSTTASPWKDYADIITRASFVNCENWVRIPENTFRGLSNLKEVILPENIEEICQYAFTGAALETIILPERLETIGNYAFSSCESLNYININDGVTSIGSSAFYNCSSLKAISIPDSVTSIGQTLFQNCGNLEYVRLSESVDKVGGSMFSGCTMLKNISLPASVTVIGSKAFSNASNLTGVYYHGTVEPTTYNPGLNNASFSLTPDTMVIYASNDYSGTTMGLKATWENDVHNVTKIDGYFVNVAHTIGGAVKVDKSIVPVGDTVTVDIMAYKNYVLDTFAVTGADGNEITVTGDSNTRTFSMPEGDVTITATFKSTIVPHVHSWTFEAEGTHINATCANIDDACHNPYQSVVMTPPSFTYFAWNLERTVKVSGTIEDVEIPEVVYTLKSTGEEVRPFEPGVYVASLTIENTTLTYEYEITKSNQLNNSFFTYTAPENLTYDGTAKIATVVPNATVDAYIGDVEVLYNRSSTPPVTVGMYTVTLNVEESDYFTAKTNLALGGRGGQKFSIVAKDIEDLDYTGLAASYPVGATPDVTIKYNGMTLVKDTDYTLVHTNNTEPGTATITVTGIGNYTGTKTLEFEISAHDHNWTYELDGTDTITATCANCAANNNANYVVTITLNAPAKTAYGDNSDANATVTQNPEGTFADLTVKYSGTKADDTAYAESTTPPTDAGTYKATLTLGTATAEVTYTIGEAAPGMTAPTATNPTYTGSDQLLVSGGNAVNGTMWYAVTDTTVVTAPTEASAWSTTVPQGTAAKTYRVWYKVVGDLNYSDTIPAYVDSTISKNSFDATITGIDGWVYGETADTPSVSNNPESGTVTYFYKLTSAGDDAYTTTVPTAAGYYTVKAVIAETDNYGEKTITANFTIAQKEITATVSAGDKTYDGNTATTVNATVNTSDLVTGDSFTITGLSGTFADANVGNGKTVTISGTAEYSGTGYGNYIVTIPTETTANITAKSLANGMLSLDSTSFIYDGNVKDPVLNVKDTLNGQDVTLTLGTDYTVDADSQNSGTNVGTYTIKITGSGNYQGSATITWKITNQTMSVSASNVEVDYNNQPHSITVNGAPNGAVITYSTDGTTYSETKPTFTDAGTYTVHYKVTCANYNEASGSATVTINIIGQTAPAAPTGTAKTAAIVELNAITTTGFGNVQYAYSTTNTAPTDGWQTETVFNDLTKNTTYYFFARYAGDQNHNPAVSEGTAITTLNTYTITYDLNGGTGTVPTAQTQDVGVVFTTASDDGFSRTGYTFLGWADTANATAAEYTKGASVSYIMTDTTLYAVWQINQYTISYDLAGGTVNGTNPTGYTLESSDITLINPTHVGYTFAGWTGTGLDGATLSVTIANGSTGDRTYTAKWTANTDTAYTVKHMIENLDGNGYTQYGNDDNKTGTTDTDTEAVAISIEGFTAPATITQQNINADGSTVVKIFYSRNSYDLTFNLDNGSNPVTTSVKYGAAITAPTGFEKTGYTFSGWDKTVAETMPANNVTYTAQWTAHTYTVKFDANVPADSVLVSGTMANQTLTYDKKEALTANTYVVKGYKFAGWVYDETTYTDKQEVVNLAADQDAVITMKAVWDPADGVSYTVKHMIEKLDGSGYDVHETDTTRTGKTGASTNALKVDIAGFTVVEPIAQQTIKGDGSTVVEIFYSRDSYKLTFDPANGSEPIVTTVKFEDTITKPSDPEKTGHTFAGWNPAVAEKMPSSDTTYTAHWTANTYTVTLITNGGTIREGNVTEYTYGVGAKLPTNVIRSGYYFGGWYDNEDCKGNAVTEISTTDIGDKTFYAKWNFIYIPIITPTYPPVVDGGDNGDVVVTPAQPEKGDTVTILPDPDVGYEVDEVIVTDKNGNPVTVVDNGDGTYSFKQPSGKVNIEVTFKEIVKVCPGDKTCPMYVYTDLDMTAWYHDGVHFCIENKLMNGTSTTTFAPGATTSRAMIVTILWRLAGEPVVNYAMSFEDVAADTWYTEAIRWAASEGIVNGYSDTAFGPNDNITREQLATILYRYEQKNGGGFKGMWMFRMDYVDLADVSDWAYEAMCWMNMNSIVNGKPGKVLDPKGNATRAEAATMLYRYCDVIGKDDEN